VIAPVRLSVKSIVPNPVRLTGVTKWNWFVPPLGTSREACHIMFVISSIACAISWD
jgi:hypothetical protein